MCRPASLAEAQRIPGVTPAALLLLLQHVRRRSGKQLLSGAPGEHEGRRGKAGALTRGWLQGSSLPFEGNVKTAASC